MVEFKNFISISYIDLQKKKNFYFKKYFISDYYSFKKNPPKLSPVQKKIDNCNTFTSCGSLDNY